MRLAGRRSIAVDDVRRFAAVVFGAGDFRSRTEDRPLPPPLAPGDRLALGPLEATVLRRLGHPRLVEIAFAGTPDAIWAGLARHGRPMQYAHLAEPLALWDVWTRVAALPVAFEPPSAGFVLDWHLLDLLRARGVGFATLTHAAGMSSTGDAALDARLPLDEPYHLPAATIAAIETTRGRGGRVVALGTTVARALEHAAAQPSGMRPGAGLATNRLGPASRLQACDALLSGSHEPGSSHHELLRAFVADATLARVDAALESGGYRTHEFGDSVFAERQAQAALELEDGDAGEQVRPGADDLARLNAERVEDAQAVLLRQHLEVGVGADADVRRVVPLVGQNARHRHAAGGDVQAIRPVREVGKADDADAADARRLAQHALGVAQVLQRVELQHDVEAAVVEQRQAFLEVQLDDVDAALVAGEHVGVGDLDAVAAAAALALQQGQQLAVAAAEVEHARALRHQLGDDLEVAFGRSCRLPARFAKHARNTPW